MKVSIEKKVASGFAATLLFLAVVSGISYWSVTRLARLAEQVDRSNQRLQRFEHLFSSLKDAETGQRGYLLTGQSAYLTPHRLGVQSAQLELQDLDKLIGTNGDQRQQITALKSLISTKLTELDRTIQLRQTQGLAAALAVVNTNAGQNTMDAIREKVQTLKNGEQFHLQQMRQQMQMQVGIVSGVVSIGGTLAFTLVPISIFAINHDLGKRKRAEALLAESEQRFRQLADATFEAIAVSEDGKLTDANERFAELFGYGSSELIGKHPTDFVPAAWTEVVAQKLQANHEQPYEVEGLRKDGTTFLMEVRSKIVSSHGRSVRVTAIRDVTEARQIAASLRHSEETNRALIHAIPDLMIRYNRSGEYLDIIPAKAFGLVNSRYDRVGKTLFDVLPPELARQRLYWIEQAFLTGEPQTYEFTAQLEDGMHYQEARIVVSGAAEALVIVRDITDRKHAEQALQQANEQLTASIQELEVRSQEIARLSTLSDMLQACLTVEEAYRSLAELIRPLFPEMTGAVLMISASKHLVEAVASWGDPDLLCQLMFTPNDCWAIRRGRSHWVGAEHTGIRCQHVSPDTTLRNASGGQTPPVETLCVPMMAQGDTLGVLHLATGQGGWVTPSRERLAVAVAEHVAVALANLRLREALQQQSIRDALTGLFNRRYLEESLERELRRSERKQQSLSIILFDVDHFKRLNDTHGHDAGDLVLRELGLFIKSQVRGSDIACRYGGEEFLLILPEASLDIAQERAERIREGFKHLNLQHRQQALGIVTLSLGVAAFPQHGTTGAAVIQVADAALYAAKHQGRDRVVTAAIAAPT